jgi:hypothetical protein
LALLIFSITEFSNCNCKLIAFPYFCDLKLLIRIRQPLFFYQLSGSLAPNCLFIVDHCPIVERGRILAFIPGAKAPD